MPNHFDQACRAAAKVESAAFVAWALRAGPDVARFTCWLDARQVRFPREPDRTCDTVARLENPADGGRPWAVPVEFQVKPDATMFGRLSGYLSGVWLDERPGDNAGDRYFTGAVVINLTGVGRTTAVMHWPELGLRHELKVIERNLSEEPAAEALAGMEGGTVPRAVLPFVPVMAGGEDVAVIGRWVALASAERDARRRATFGSLAVVFAEAAKRREAWKEALKGWHMVESQQVLEWQAEARAEGEAKGEARGRAEERAASVIEVLQGRFGPLPAGLPDSIRTAAYERLQAALGAALGAASVDEFRARTGF